MSLRLKLLSAILALVVAGMAVAGVVTYIELRTFLLRRVDQQLTAAQMPVLTGITHDGDSSHGGPDGGPQMLPSGTFGQLRDPSGQVTAQGTFQYGGRSQPGPALPATLPTDGRAFTTGASDGSSLRYRVLAQPTRAIPFNDEQGTLVVAIPLTETDQTLRQLVVIEGLVAGGVVLVLGLVSWWLVRREMRPLEEIGVTAGAIADGDLSQRIPQQDPRTEIGQLGTALNAMLAQIERAFDERTASEDRLRRFLADASHELRTPLTSIRGYAELFRRGASRNGADLATSMRRIEDEAARMGVLVEDLLLLARLDQDRALQLGSVDVSALAGDAVRDARAASPRRRIDLDAPGPVIVLADEARIRQVAANLISNAVRHTPTGTPAVVRVFEDGSDAVLEVVDRGPGLAADEAERVFEPFYRSDPSRDRTTGGAGLGLSIVSAIATAHGGSVEFLATPGGGATFRVRIPAGTEAPHDRALEPLAARPTA